MIVNEIEPEKTPTTSISQFDKKSQSHYNKKRNPKFTQPLQQSNLQNHPNKKIEYIPDFGYDPIKKVFKNTKDTSYINNTIVQRDQFTEPV